MLKAEFLDSSNWYVKYRNGETRPELGDDFGCCAALVNSIADILCTLFSSAILSLLAAVRATSLTLRINRPYK